MPEMISVDSSTVAAIGYDADSQELYIRFVSGALYVYFEVPQHVVDAFMAAPSKGRFFNQEIRPVYRWSKQ